MEVVPPTRRPQPFASGDKPGNTLIAWRPNHELDIREWAAAGRRIGAVGRCIQWLLGDWIAYGSSKFREKYVRAAKITGYDTQSLMNMVYVASRFSVSRRRENLSWSHHEAVAALQHTDQSHWLDQAVEHRWSVADLRMMPRSARRQKDSEHGAERVTLYHDLADDHSASQLTPKQKRLSGGIRQTSIARAGTIVCPHCGEEVKVASSSL